MIMYLAQLMVFFVFLMSGKCDFLIRVLDFFGLIKSMIGLFNFCLVAEKVAVNRKKKKKREDIGLDYIFSSVEW